MVLTRIGMIRISVGHFVEPTGASWLEMPLPSRLSRDEWMMQNWGLAMKERCNNNVWKVLPKCFLSNQLHCLLKLSSLSVFRDDFPNMFWCICSFKFPLASYYLHKFLYTKEEIMPRKSMWSCPKTWLLNPSTLVLRMISAGRWFSWGFRILFH